MNLFGKGFRFKYDSGAVSDELARYLYGLKGVSGISPRRLFIYPTIYCNDSCKYCDDGLHYHDARSKALAYGKKGDFFSNKKYIDRLARDIRELGIIDIHLFGGGEPFFYRENMLYFLERLKDVDVFVRVITNTKGLGEKDIRWIVKNRLVSQLNISLNSDSQDTAGKIYADASRHKHTLDIIGWIDKYKKLYKTDFPKIDIMFIVLNVNYDKIMDILELLKSHRINYFFFQPLRVCTDKQKQFLLTPEDREIFEKQVPLIKNKFDELKIKSNIDELRGREDPRVDPAAGEPVNDLALKSKDGMVLNCYMPLTTLSICYNGNIPFCQFSFHNQYSVNYFDMCRLNDFIRGKEYSGFTGQFIGGRLPELCDGCKFCVPSELAFIRERMSVISKV
jgi:MoaA/NifB/PqqE/SkfB family radical SAM enzyme